MKVLDYGLNLNNAEVAELIRTTRKALYTANPSNRRQYTIRGVAEAIGISPTYYEELENNKNEVVKLKPIYAICKYLRIPINVIVQLSLNLSDGEMRKHFLKSNDEQYSHDNGVVLKNAREQLKVTQEDVAKVIGCSKSHFAYCEEGKKAFKDIRPLYKICVMLDVPMYVLIRNELGLSNEELQSIIQLPKDNSKREIKISIPNDDSVELRIKTLDIVSTLNLEDLETLFKILPAFHK